MAEGRSNQAIGERLFLGPKTVEAHLHGIFTRLDLHAAPTTTAASSPSLHSCGHSSAIALDGN
jgi:DNA-binding NarL/FixJ family response regulator